MSVKNTYDQIINYNRSAPQIIKVSVISCAIANLFTGEVSEKILLIGQYYDAYMSQFFDELNISYPDFNLDVSSGSHANHKAKNDSGY